MNNVFIVGASGYIGSKLYDYLDVENKWSVGRNNNDIYLDLSDGEFEPFLSNVESDDIVVFLSAISSPDICENEYEHAYNINVRNTSKLIFLLLSKNVRVIFSSSDAVFGNALCICDENSKKAPFGKYGEMKSEIEDKFSNDKNFFITRFSYVLGHGDNFSRLVAEHFYDEKLLDVFNGFERSVISLDDILLGMRKIIKNWNKIKTRIVNFSGDELVSRQAIVSAFYKYKYPSLNYSFTNAPEKFWDSRPKKIHTKSLYLESILEKPLESYQDVIRSQQDG
jgi:dTDP-4-dehydrorhamnose reductase